MRIKFVEISNFRKLKSTHLDFDRRTTILVGANNSGKTSAMVALRYFLLAPNRLALRDVTIANWTRIDAVGTAWEKGAPAADELNDLLPCLDVWLDVPITEIQHVVHILPTLEWNGGLIGVRLKYELDSLDRLKADYLLNREAAVKVATPGGGSEPITIWPERLTDFLERKLRAHVQLSAYPLDPAAVVPPKRGAVMSPRVGSSGGSRTSFVAITIATSTRRRRLPPRTMTRSARSNLPSATSTNVWKPVFRRLSTSWRSSAIPASTTQSSRSQPSCAP